jgi:NAD(P)-dependent dehydrogenase (short-subunit alcohol dehydrogenase family)
MRREKTSAKPVVFLSSITSDIGVALARHYVEDGWTVAGTYRSTRLLPQLRELGIERLYFCDLAQPATIAASTKEFAATGLRWDTFISLASLPPPLCGFFEADFEQWNHSVHVNAIEQLRQLHALYPLRRTGRVADVVFFAGPGTNGAPSHFSALTVSKIMLIKMCELLQADAPDINPFIVGPGWTRTKTHDLILADPHVSADKKAETEAFLARGGGTPMSDIYRSVRWLCEQGREVSGGRNFSIVHDLWGSDELATALKKDPWMYKLRRHGNAFKQRTQIQ